MAGNTVLTLQQSCGDFSITEAFRRIDTRISHLRCAFGTPQVRLRFLLARRRCEQQHREGIGGGQRSVPTSSRLFHIL